MRAPATVQIRPVRVHAVRQNGVVARCPPWALPGEEIPLHVQIPKDVTPEIKSVHIRLDDSLEVRCVINLPDYVQDGQTLSVRSLNRDSMADYDYFGVAVATSAPFKELKKEVPVLVELEHLDGTVQKVTEQVRIFRYNVMVTVIPAAPRTRVQRRRGLKKPKNLKLVLGPRRRRRRGWSPKRRLRSISNGQWAPKVRSKRPTGTSGS